MIRLLIYLFPLALDMVLGTLFFVCSLRMAESGASALAVSMVCIAWALTYAITSFLAGRLVKPGNLVRYAVGSCLALAVLSGLFILLPGLRTQYVLLVGSGIAIALFYTPFQAFMKAVMSGTKWTLNVSTGLYTAAWSTGMALGPFVSGFLWQHFNWQVCHLVNAAAALGCAWGVYRLRHYAVDSPSAVAAAVTSSVPEEPENRALPDLALVGWLCGGIGFLIVAAIRAVYPTLATALGIGKVEQGTMFALLFGTQAATGLALGFFRKWLYRLEIPVWSTLIGAGGLLLLGFGRGGWYFFPAALLIGLYLGMCCDYFVFHSLVHPCRSTRNVAVNETIVGVTGILGPLGGGLLGDAFGLSMPFLAASVLAGAAILLQWRWYAQRMKRDVAAILFQT